MNNIKKFNEFTINEESKFKNLIAAGLIFFASCSSNNIDITNRYGEKVPYAKYQNSVVNGVINNIELLKSGKIGYFYRCEILDDSNNYIQVVTDYTEDSLISPRKGDKVRLRFNTDGDYCEIYKNSQSDTNRYRRIK